MGRQELWAGALVLSATGLGLGGCNDDHFGNGGGADPTGVYEGTLTDAVTHQSTSVLLIIDEAGAARMSAQNGTYYQFNDVTTDGDNFFASLFGLSNQVAFPNGGLTTTGRVSGAVTVPGLSLAFTAAGADSGSIDLNFDNVYLNASSLPTLAGTYTTTSGTPALTMTVSSAGAISGADSLGCSYAGQFSLVDPTLNAYEETITQFCNGASLTFSGVADFVPAVMSGTTTTTPAQINLLADDNTAHFIARTLVQVAVVQPASTFLK